MKIEIYLKNIGPAAIITAAFIGPGTVTTCIKAGFETRYSLLGIMVFAIIVAVLIQVFAAKIGIITQMGISKNIRENTPSPVGRAMSLFLIATTIFIGNSAFEAGNITGAVIGLTGLIGKGSFLLKVIIISSVVFLLLWNGKYRHIEIILEIAVLIMAICFLVAAILCRPNLVQMAKEAFDFNIFHNNAMLAGALIGTTVGPYSIFLHSETAAEHWHSSSDIKYMIFDTVVSISLGGVISCCIMIVAASTAQELQITELTITNFMLALSNPIGSIGQFIFYLGLLAAGITSAITAPLAAAYTIIGCYSQKTDKQSRHFKVVWGLVLVIGSIISVIWGNSPAELIVIVQLANAVILPLIMIFLYKCLNSNQMGQHKNNIFANVILLLLIIICCFLSIQNLYHIILLL